MLGPMTYGALQSGGAAPARTYAQILVEDYGADEVWPLVDIESGTTIHAQVNENRDGTLQGWDLQNTAGPVADTLAPFSDAVNDYGNILTSNGSDGLVDIFNGAEGSLFLWLKMASAAVWSDASFRYLFRLHVNNSNFWYLAKPGGGASRLEFTIKGGATTKQVVLESFSSTDWFSMGMSVSQSSGASGEMKAFINGAQTGTTQTSLGTFAGTPTVATLGAADTTPTLVHNGYLAYAAVKFGSVWTPTDFQNMHNAATA